MYQRVAQSDFLKGDDSLEQLSRKKRYDPLAPARAEFACPACGAPVYQGDRYFTDGRNVIACEHCPSRLA